ncbi:hypothetical protein TSUD_206880 [Trifolium subterraneum]|uniref:Uncharacterized protein n=1 Tax=Trifolium subterraneum TaxID=3900 RepID=A0A2Z6NLG1_TRISU|nr:hypothetical protein TSUD_206880 [Trifolium subterraneum]
MGAPEKPQTNANSMQASLILLGTCTYRSTRFSYRCLREPVNLEAKLLRSTTVPLTFQLGHMHIPINNEKQRIGPFTSTLMKEYDWLESMEVIKIDDN